MMKYKVGDKVRVKSLEWYNENKDCDGFIHCHGINFTPRMLIFCGCVLTISAIDHDIYYVEENLCVWKECMFEGIVDYKENMGNFEITLNDKKYIIDVEKAIELGVVKEKDSRCKSWEEFKNKYLKKQGFFYDECDMSIALTNNPTKVSEQLTENEAIAIKAFSKLLKLRRDWIGNWNPDFCDSNERKFCIEVYKNELYVITNLGNYSKTFSFPTKEMAEEFLECFKNLFDQCKCII